MTHRSLAIAAAVALAAAAPAAFAQSGPIGTGSMSSPTQTGTSGTYAAPGTQPNSENTEMSHPGTGNAADPCAPTPNMPSAGQQVPGSSKCSDTTSPQQGPGGANPG